MIFDKSLYPQFVECVGRYKRPLASWMGHEASGDTATMLGQVFDHQAANAAPGGPRGRLLDLKAKMYAG